MKPWRHYMYEPHCTLLLTKEWIKIQINKNKEININPSRYYVNWTRLLLTGIIPVSSLVYFNTRIFKVSVLDLDLHVRRIFPLLSDHQKLDFTLVCNIAMQAYPCSIEAFSKKKYALWRSHQILFLQGKDFNSCFIWCIITVILNRMCNINYHKTQRTEMFSLFLQQ